MERWEKAAVLAVVAGIFLLIAGVSGATAWSRVRDIVVDLTGGNPVLELVFLILVAIASLGGLLVILGGALFWRGETDWGRALVFIGTGVGLISLLIFVALHGLKGTLLAIRLHWVGFIGVILAIVSGVVAEG